MQNPPITHTSGATLVSFVRRFSIRTVATVTFFAILWLGLWRQLSSEWSVNDQYSYGWFVPFFSVVLYWLRFEDPPAPDVTGYKSHATCQTTGNRERITDNPRAHPVAIIIAVVALLFLFPIRLFEIGNPDWRPLNWLHALCVVVMTLVFLWLIGGKPWLRHFAFPVAFTLVAVPWVTPIEQPIVQGLMRAVASISSEAVALFGIPTQLQGNLIRIPDGLVGLNEACSGVRSLQTSLMIGLLFGELKRLSIFRRLGLTAGAAAIAFIGNIIRAFALVWISATRDIAAANRWHDLTGYGIVVLVFLGTFALTWLLGRKRQGQLSHVTPHRPQNSKFETRNSKLPAAAIVWLLFTEIAAAGWYRGHEHDLVLTKRWEVQWPRRAANFHEIKIDDDVRRALRFDAGRAATWNLPALKSDEGEIAPIKPLNCTLYFFRWEKGKNSALLANLHRPDVCLPSIGWNQSGDTGVKRYPISPELTLPFRHFKFQHGSPGEPTQQIAHAFYCLWEDNVSPTQAKSQLPEMTTSPSAWTRNERVRAVLDGRRHLGQQVLELVIQSRGTVDDERIDTHFAEVIPQVVKVQGP